MIVIFLAAVMQLFSSRLSAAGILLILACTGFVIMTGLTGDLEMMSVILFVAGVILMILELFVIGAVLGIIGALMVFSSFLLIGEDISKMAVFLAISLALALMEWIVMVKFFGKSIPLFKNVILTDSTSKEAGYSSHDDRSHLVGKIALTMTPLRPSGIITFEGKRIDAVSEGAFIDKDREVSIILVEGTRVVVRAL
ncbi:NfeD family protein [Macrococcus brunensis]|uniref:NfeD family protein n=1 Tax=Macrococcus brunensis TaxID=198483 RepID=UPI001EEFC608|nr:NfeD family protein [Macrococcus brunensis]ULG71132.1 serine protease [Macrococcus brunensis]